MENNALLCYPRSGSNWVRYLIEYLSDYETVSLPIDTTARKPWHLLTDTLRSDNKSENKRFYHTHGWTDNIFAENRNILTPNYKMIYVMRNPKESLVRHIVMDKPTVSDKDMNTILEDFRRHYLPYLIFFDEYKGEKLLLRYEELIDVDYLIGILYELSTFLGNPIRPLGIDYFLEHYDLHVATSRGMYHGKKVTDGKTKIFHSAKLTEQQHADLDNWINSMPNLKKYFNYE